MDDDNIVTFEDVYVINIVNNTGFDNFDDFSQELNENFSAGFYVNDDFVISSITGLPEVVNIDLKDVFENTSFSVTPSENMRFEPNTNPFFSISFEPDQINDELVIEVSVSLYDKDEYSLYPLDYVFYYEEKNDVYDIQLWTDGYEGLKVPKGTVIQHLVGDTNTNPLRYYESEKLYTYYYYNFNYPNYKLIEELINEDPITGVVKYGNVNLRSTIDGLLVELGKTPEERADQSISGLSFFLNSSDVVKLRMNGIDSYTILNHTNTGNETILLPVGTYDLTVVGDIDAEVESVKGIDISGSNGNYVLTVKPDHDESSIIDFTGNGPEYISTMFRFDSRAEYPTLHAINEKIMSDYGFVIEDMPVFEFIEGWEPYNPYIVSLRDITYSEVMPVIGAYYYPPRVFTYEDDEWSPIIISADLSDKVEIHWDIEFKTPDIINIVNNTGFDNFDDFSEVLQNEFTAGNYVESDFVVGTIIGSPVTKYITLQDVFDNTTYSVLPSENMEVTESINPFFSISNELSVIDGESVITVTIDIYDKDSYNLYPLDYTFHYEEHNEVYNIDVYVDGYSGLNVPKDTFGYVFGETDTNHLKYYESEKLYTYYYYTFGHSVDKIIEELVNEDPVTGIVEYGDVELEATVDGAIVELGETPEDRADQSISGLVFVLDPLDVVDLKINGVDSYTILNHTNAGGKSVLLPVGTYDLTVIGDIGKEVESVKGIDISGSDGNYTLTVKPDHDTSSVLDFTGDVPHSDGMSPYWRYHLSRRGRK